MSGMTITEIIQFFKIICEYQLTFIYLLKIINMKTSLILLLTSLCILSCKTQKQTTESIIGKYPKESEVVLRYSEGDVAVIYPFETFKIEYPYPMTFEAFDTLRLDNYVVVSR